MIVSSGILRAYQYQERDDLEQPVADDSQEEIISQQSEGVSSQEEQIILSNEEKVMQSSLHTILDALSEDNPSLVSEVKCVVQELRRITLLWDELWLGSLTQLHQEAQRWLFLLYSLCRARQ